MNQRPEYDMRKTGENLKRLRRQNGYTADEVRKYVGIGTVHAVYKWERGESFPTLDNFFALAELYGADPMDIIVRRERDNLLISRELGGTKQRTHPLECYYCLLHEGDWPRGGTVNQ